MLEIRQGILYFVGYRIFLDWPWRSLTLSVLPLTVTEVLPDVRAVRVSEVTFVSIITASIPAVTRSAARRECSRGHPRLSARLRVNHRTIMTHITRYMRKRPHYVYCHGIGKKQYIIEWD